MQLKFFNLPVDIRQRIYKINDDRILNRLKVRNDYFKRLLYIELERMNDDIIAKYHDMCAVDENWGDVEAFMDIPKWIIDWINEEYRDAKTRWDFIRDCTNDLPIKRYTRFNSKFDNEPIIICRRIDKEVDELRGYYYYDKAIECYSDSDSDSDSDIIIHYTIDNQPISNERTHHTWLYKGEFTF